MEGEAVGAVVLKDEVAGESRDRSAHGERVVVQVTTTLVTGAAVTVPLAPC